MATNEDKTFLILPNKNSKSEQQHSKEERMDCRVFKALFMLVLAALIIATFGMVIAILVRTPITPAVTPPPVVPASLTAGSISVQSANGFPVPTDKYGFAGVMFVPLVNHIENCSATTTTAYGSCGTSLIKGFGLPHRRVVLTAAHCLDITFFGVASLSDLYPITVSFKRNPGMVIDPQCLVPRRPIAFDATGNNVFTANHAWVSNVDFSAGYGIGMDKTDHALVLLDEEVPEAIVPENQIAEIIIRPQPSTLNRVTLPKVGVVGYGTVTWGSNSNLLGKPSNIVGPRNAQFVTQDTKSFQAWNIVSTMVGIRNDQTLCNGDSGSAAINLGNPSNTEIVGTVYGGDPQCRSTNTWNRVDTLEFESFVASVADEISCAAYGC